MKKIVLLAALVATALPALALDHEPVEGFDAQLVFGMNVSSVRGTAYDLNTRAPGIVDLDAKAGLNVGILGRYVLPEAHGFYVLAGAEWSQKGGKYDRVVEWSDNTFNCTHKINAHYINIPVRGGFHYNVNRDWGVYGEFGPYFAIGICGKNKITTDADGSDASEMEKTLKYNTFSKNSGARALGGLQRFDCGLGLRFGAEYRSIYSLNMGFDWGLTDMLRDEYRDYHYDMLNYKADKLRNFNFSITLGYRFGRSKSSHSSRSYRSGGQQQQPVRRW